MGQVLEAALADLVVRHEGLRTVIGAEEGVAYQQLIPHYTQHLTTVDLSTLDPSQRAPRRLKPRPAVFRSRQLDLARLPVLYTLLLRVGPQEHILLLLMHHIFGDGWVLNLLSDECGSRYYLRMSGAPLAWAPLPLQYADYARWQRSLPDSYYADKCQWWAEALAGMPPVLSMPLDHPRPALQTYNGAVFEQTYPHALIERLEALGNQHQASLYMVLLATFNTLLYRYSHQTDFGVGSAAANRTRQEFERMSGLFMNAIVMRTPIRPEQTFLSYLGQVRTTTLGALANQDVPFELLTERLAPERNTSHALWFQVALILNLLPKTANLPGITIRPLPNDVVEAKLDLTLYLFRSEEGILAHAEYNRDLFEARTMRALLGHYLQALTAVLENPAVPLYQLTILTQEERAQLLETWNNTAIALRHDPAHPPAVRGARRCVARTFGGADGWQVADDRT